MAVKRTRKKKENAHHHFLYSWQPSEPDVKRETNFAKNLGTQGVSSSKRAEILAKDNSYARIKKDIVKSLAMVGLMLMAEVVVYLARSEFKLP